MISSSSVSTSLGGTITHTLTFNSSSQLTFLTHGTPGLGPWSGFDHHVAKFCRHKAAVLALPGTNSSGVVMASAFPVKYQLSLWKSGYATKENKYLEFRFRRSCLDHTDIWACGSGWWRCWFLSSKIPQSHLPTGPLMLLSPT